MKYVLRIMVFAVIALFMIHNSLFIIPVLATDGIGQSRISPASPLYFLKSVREVLELKFAGTAHVKSIRELEFAHRRLREVKSLVKTPGEDLIEPTLERYWSAWMEYNKSINLKDEISAAEVSKAAVLHMNVLQGAYNQVSTVAAKRSLRSTINKLSKWDRGTNLSACKLLSQEASSSALNEVERVVYQARAGECYGSF